MDIIQICLWIIIKILELWEIILALWEAIPDPVITGLVVGLGLEFFNYARRVRERGFQKNYLKQIIQKYIELIANATDYHGPPYFISKENTRYEHAKAMVREVELSLNHNSHLIVGRTKVEVADNICTFFRTVSSILPRGKILPSAWYDDFIDRASQIHGLDIQKIQRKEVVDDSRLQTGQIRSTVDSDETCGTVNDMDTEKMGDWPPVSAVDMWHQRLDSLPEEAQYTLDWYRILWVRRRGYDGEQVDKVFNEKLAAINQAAEDASEAKHVVAKQEMARILEGTDWCVSAITASLLLEYRRLTPHDRALARQVLVKKVLDQPDQNIYPIEDKTTKEAFAADKERIEESLNFLAAKAVGNSSVAAAGRCAPMPAGSRDPSPSRA